MARTAAKSPIFKFVALRPVQAVDGGRKNLLFLRYGKHDSSLSPLAERMLSTDSEIGRRQIAEEFIRSDDYIYGFDYPVAGMAALREVRRIVDQATPQTNLDSLRDRILGTLRQSGGALQPGQDDSPVKDRLWDSLGAAFVSPLTRPHDRAELMDAIAAYGAIERLESFGSTSDLLTASRARPVLPEALIENPGSRATTREPDEGAKAAFEAKVAKIDSLRLEIVQLEEAIRDIDLTQQRALHAAPADRPEALVPSAASASAASDSRGAAEEARDFDFEPVGTALDEATWKLSDTAVEMLSPKTTELVGSTQRDVKLDTRLELVSALENAQADAYMRLYRLGGSSATIGLGTIESQDTTYDDMPWHPGEDAQFNHSISGSVGTVRPVGVGDLLITAETILRYQEGEVAHIENVLKSEQKERIHRRLDREEVTTFTSTELTEESTQDLQNTERYELQTETANTIRSETSRDIGVGISVSYGPLVSVDTSADFSTSNSVENSKRSATSYAQEVVERSISKITQSVKEELTTKLITEIEETNTHGFNNSSGTDHAIGVYRWVDKYYEAQVYNYGKRLMLELIVPEPAAFYVHAQGKRPQPQVTVAKPEPLDDNFSFKDIKKGNYQIWVDLYQVPDVSPPPPLYKIIGKALNHHGGGTAPYTVSDQLDVPEG